MTAKKVFGFLLLTVMVSPGYAKAGDYGGKLLEIAGNDLIISYHRGADGKEYVLNTEDQAVSSNTTSAAAIFLFRSANNASSVIKYQDQQKVGLDIVEGQFQGRYGASGLSKFSFSQLNGERLFIIWKATGEPLVTPMVVPPFTFYLQSRYPLEPPAVFSIAQIVLNVTKHYAGRRYRIVETCGIINRLPNLNKTEAYLELLKAMEAYGHTDGSEIFAVANLIVESFSMEGEPFASLPSQVRTVMSGKRLFFKYLLNNQTWVPMKYYWASPSNVDDFGYNLTMGNADKTRWAITYGDVHHLYLDSYDLRDTLVKTKDYEFSFEYDATHEAVRIYTYYKMAMIPRHRDRDPIYFQRGYENIMRAQFSIK